MLGIAGATWSYFAWRQSSRARYVLAFVLFGVTLVYTNYLGLGVPRRPRPPPAGESPGRPRALDGGGRGAGDPRELPSDAADVLAGSWRAGPASAGRSSWLAADTVYLGYAMLVSESVAPWHWPAAFAVVGITALLYVSLRTPRVRWLLGLLALVFLSAVLIGVVHNRRVGLFGPWLILYLTGLLACTTLRRTAAAAVLLVFGTGWAGILSERWYATYRHIEPWQEVASTALDLVGPGDPIVCSHPSFYFYVAHQLGWEDRHEPLPIGLQERNHRVFSALSNWERAVAGGQQVLYVRGAVNESVMAEEQRLADFLGKNYRLTFERRYLEDSASPFKNRFFPNQPRWRIELRRYQRVESGSSP